MGRSRPKGYIETPQSESCSPAWLRPPLFYFTLGPHRFPISWDTFAAMATSRFLHQLGRYLARFVPGIGDRSLRQWNRIEREILQVIERKRFAELDILLEKATGLARGSSSEIDRIERLNFLGEIYWNEAGNNRQAEELFRAAAEAADRMGVGGRRQLLLSRNNLALLLTRQKRLTEAEPLLRGLIPRVEAEFGADHVEMAAILENLAAVLRQTGREEEANGLRHKALGIRRQIRLKN